MDDNEFLYLETDIGCGKWKCLANCCDLDSLRDIWKLMNSMSVDDVRILSRLLCCEVAANAANESTASTQNCWLTTRNFVCQHKILLASVPAAMAAVAFALPRLAVAATAIGTVAIELAKDCDSSSNDESVMSSFVRLICYLNGQVREMRKTIGETIPDALKPAVDFLDKWIVGIATLDWCCPVGTQPELPTPPESPWEYLQDLWKRITSGVGTTLPELPPSGEMNLVVPSALTWPRLGG